MDAHVLVAAMEFLGMEDIDAKPNTEMFPTGVWMLDKELKEILLSVCGAIVEEFTDISTFKPTQDTSNNDDDSNNRKSEDRVLSYAKVVLSFLRKL